MPEAYMSFACLVRAIPLGLRARVWLEVCHRRLSRSGLGELDDGMADDNGFDSILNLNPQSAQHSQWLVRVALKQVLLFTIEARGQKVPAKKFLCVLVGADPTAYIMATVRHDFKDATKVVAADAKFKMHAVYTMTKPIPDTTAKSLWIGAPVKMQILLDQSKMTPVLAGSSAHNTPAKYIQPRMKLAQVLEIQESRRVDFAAIIVAISDPKDVQVAGQRTTVRDLTVRDDSLHNGSVAEATLSVWGDTGTQFADAKADAGITIVGCHARCTGGEVRLDARADSALFCVGSNANIEDIRAKIRTLDSAPAGPPTRSSVTASFTPGGAVKVDGDAPLVNCAILMAMKGGEAPSQEDRPFQVNDAMVEITGDSLMTKDGTRLFATGVVRDWSGAARVAFVQSGLLNLYDIGDAEREKFTDVQKAMTAASTSPTQPTSRRVNLRGVVRAVKGEVSILVSQTADSDFKVIPTQAAERLMFMGFLSGRGSDGVVVAPLSRIAVDNVSGMTVRTDDDQRRPVHRAIVLVKGTTKTVHKNINGSRQMTSKGVRCILSTDEDQTDAEQADVIAYCHEDAVSDYQIHEQHAAVLVSSARLGQDAPESACGRVLVADAVWIILGDDVKAAKAAFMKQSHLALAPTSAGTPKHELADLVTPDPKRPRCRTIQKYPTDTGEAAVPK